MKIVTQLASILLVVMLGCGDATSGDARNEASEPIKPLPLSVEVDWTKAKLGRRLFFDTRLSHDDTVSCASCHPFNHGGADPRERSSGVGGALSGTNAPTVWNSAYNFRQLWEGGPGTLEQQIDGVIANRKVMASSWDEILGKLRDDAGLVRQFRAAYPEGLTADSVMNAIATYERTLITPNAPFDRYLRGDTTAISDEAKTGYALFKQKGCISCHQGMNVGGNLFAVFGVMGDYFHDRGHITPADYGRFNVTKRESDRFVFKVPSLRNVELTAPYFHDGSAQTLDEAVATMAKYQVGRMLSVTESRAIVEFLRSLTGEFRERRQ